MTDSSLICHSVSFSYPKRAPILRELSANFGAGAVTAIIGPNGVGKSTLLKLLLGVLTPSSGSVQLDGEPLESHGRAARASRVAYVPQRSSVAGPFSTRAVVAMGRFAHSATGSRPFVEQALDAVELLQLSAQPFGTLSVGQQQRATLARALAQLGLPLSTKGPLKEDSQRTRSESPTAAVAPASFLLLDEPVSAMDPAHAFHTMDLLKSLALSGVGVIIVLHDLALVARYADTVLAIDSSGRAAALGPTRDTLTPDLLSSLYGVPFRAVADSADAPPLLVPHHP